MTRRILNIIKPIAILLVETEIWPNFLRIAKGEQIPVMMVNGRISDRSMSRYMHIKSFMHDMLGSIDRFCMQSKLDAEYITVLGANVKEVTVTGNTKYDQTYATVTEEEKEQLQHEFGFGHNHPIIVAGSTHKGEEDKLFQAFKEILQSYPNARLLIAPREIMRGNDVKALSQKYGLKAICRSTMTEPVHEEIPVVILDTIGELGRLYSLGDIIFVGGSLVKTGGHNILEPAAHGKPIIVHDERELLEVLQTLCANQAMRDEMSRHCLEVVSENRGATQRNTEELRRLFERFHIVP